MAADLDKIAKNAAEIRDLVVAENEAFTAFSKAFHAAQDAILRLATEIEEEVQGGDDLPVLDIHDATVREGEVARFRLIMNRAATVPASARYSTDLAATPDGTVTVPAGATEAVLELDIGSASAVAGDFMIELFDPISCALGDATATGRILPPAPTGDLWERALFLHEEPLAAADAPISFPPGELADLKSVALVVKVADVDKFQKFMGGPSSGSADQGAFGIGANPALGLDVWRAGGGEMNQLANPPSVPADVPSLLGFYWDDEIALGPPWVTQVLHQPLTAIDGPVYLGAGSWANQHPHDPIQPDTVILAAAGWAEMLTAEQWAQVRARWEHLLVDDGGNGGNGNGGGNPEHPVEAVDPRLHQVTLAVAADAPTHVWLGGGVGLNAFDSARSVFPRVKQHKARLDRIGMHVLRIFSPHARADCVAAYKPYYDLFKPRLVAASGFVYRSGGSARANIRALAEGVRYCWDHGLPIHIVTNQNEPDGNEKNAPRDGRIADHHRQLREDLDSLGLQRVQVATLEWRHPPQDGIPEFDELKAAGLIGTGKAVTIGCGHVYDKVQGLDLADRLRSVGCTWSSWETGNNGSGTSSVARALSAANLGSAFDCLHYVMITTATPNSEQMGQAFLDYGGKDRPWAGHWEVVFGKALVPDSTIYRCSSSDRAPGMPTTMDQWMVRNAAVSGGRNPRLNVVVGRRKDGQTAIVATNTTSGSDAFNKYTSGHYGDLDQQHTLRVPWLAGKDGSFQVWRASPEGAVSGPQVVGMDAGLVRWSVPGGWTAGLVGGSA